MPKISRNLEQKIENIPKLRVGQVLSEPFEDQLLQS